MRMVAQQSYVVGLEVKIAEALNILADRLEDQEGQIRKLRSELDTERRLRLSMSKRETEGDDDGPKMDRQATGDPRFRACLCRRYCRYKKNET